VNLGVVGGPFALNIHGPFNGWFTTVTGIAVDSQGHVFVADFYNHRVQKFAVDGTVFVTDYGNHRVQAWQPASQP
jgi:hypothetical protein